ncbi:hypothetical protein HHI36_016779 [Cryptolaemus montrouzieri]|uniref:Uncharacterized protein n=1 Tax=Cryptolaemus montrouzieri TaxID=559131 RepID=A0ABD2NKT6_9CUCU
MDILKKLNRGEKKCKFARQCDIGRASINDLKKTRKTVGHVRTMQYGQGKRKTLRVRDCPKVDKGIYMLFMQKRSRHTPISAEILKAKAIEFYESISEKVIWYPPVNHIG